MPKTSELTTVIPTIDDFAAFLNNADISLKKMSLLSMNVLFNAYHYAPEWFMINGKIVPTVTTSNLNVAIKTNVGADPSVADPVYIMIGWVMRILTTALSVTLNAGTNWWNAGSAELATQEIDWFTYLWWDSTTSVVVIGVSRFPQWRLYSDFSNTTTNEKYIGRSTSTPVAWDTYQNIGRFAATLGVSITYLWTIPAYTSLNLIQRPIYETRPLGFNSTISASWSMTVTSPVKGWTYYKITWDTIEVIASYSFTLWWSASNEVKFTLPFWLSQVVSYTIEWHWSYYNTTNDLAVVCQMDNANNSIVRVKRYDSAVYTLWTSQDVKISIRHKI